MEAELKKGMSGNVKLSHWVVAFSKASDAIRCAAFVAFWLCKFIFGSHLHYVVKPLYFRLAINISTGVSLPLAPMFLGHLYVQLDILQSDKEQASSCHIVTTSPHSTILQHLSWERCAWHLAKCKSIHFTNEKYRSCPKIITNFCDCFISDFSLAYCWVGLKPFRRSNMELFDKGVGFCWIAYRNLGTSYKCRFSHGTFY